MKIFLTLVILVAFMSGYVHAAAGTVELVVISSSSTCDVPYTGYSSEFEVPNSPAVSISAEGTQVDFQVDADIYREGTHIVIDFHDLRDEMTDKGHTTGSLGMFQGSACSSYPNLAYADSGTYPNGLTTVPSYMSTFDPEIVKFSDGVHSPVDTCDWFISAPNAVWDSNAWKDYAPGINFDGSEVGRWKYSVSDCNTLAYTASFTLAELGGYQDSENGFCYRAVRSVDTGTIDSLQYEGHLYVHYFRPKDSSISPLTEAGVNNLDFPGYDVIVYKYKFTVTLNTISHIVTSISQYTFSQQVEDMGFSIVNDIAMVTMHLRTSLTPGTTGIAYDLVSMSNADVHLCDASGVDIDPQTATITADSTASGVQTWTFRFCNSQEIPSFDGAYTFEWTSDGNPLKVIMNLDVDSQVFEDYTIDIDSAENYGQELKFFDNYADFTDSAQTTSIAGFTNNMDLYIRHGLQGLDDTEKSKLLRLDLYKASICFATFEAFDPTPFGGCRQAYYTGSGVTTFEIYDAAAVEGGPIFDWPAENTADPMSLNPEYYGPDPGVFHVGELDATVYNGLKIKPFRLDVDGVVSNYYFDVESYICEYTEGDTTPCYDLGGQKRHNIFRVAPATTARASIGGLKFIRSSDDDKDTSSDSGSMATGSLVGIIAGAAVACVVGGILVLIIVRRRKSKNQVVPEPERVMEVPSLELSVSRDVLISRAV